MTGKWLYGDVGEKHLRATYNLISYPVEYTAAIKDFPRFFAPKIKLNFIDVRKFGTLEYVEKLEDFEPFTRLGVDGLDLNTKEAVKFVYRNAKRSRKPIKNFLLDQSVIAGNGNIYCCACLFLSGIHPEVPAKNLTYWRIRSICKNLYKLFKQSIARGGTSISDYVNSKNEKGSFQYFLNVYGREGKPCRKCSTKIEKIVQAGRSTFFCPKCQKFGGKKNDKKSNKRS